MLNRRQFSKGLVAAAFSGLATNLLAKTLTHSEALLSADLAYGSLHPDVDGILDLPAGFNYRVLSKRGAIMNDGLKVPNRADGMGCLALDNERCILIRNHEISPYQEGEMDSRDLNKVADLAYDIDYYGRALPGGTSHIVYNTKTGLVEKEYMSLIGTVRNCSGGITPWNSWLTCEESTLKAGEKNNKDHGYIFEVPATAAGLVEPVPLKAMGRFNHEAACVDPKTGIVYLTEDRNDSLFYRFIPNKNGELAKGGRLQALVVSGKPQCDTRNWSVSTIVINDNINCEWIDIDDVTSPNDDLRIRGHNAGAALFARGEGIYFGNGEMYFCCTNGGPKKLGQIMRYKPSPFEGTENESKLQGQLCLFVESLSKAQFNYGDNLVVAPNGHLIVCEDQYTETVSNSIKGVTPQGKTYNIAKVIAQTEPAGVCFSPDGKTLFVNLYSPTATLAITGPWQSFIPD